jgi:hypothetical protein
MGGEMKKCVWNVLEGFWLATCEKGGSWGSCNSRYPVRDFPHCPYCGGKIELSNHWLVLKSLNELRDPDQIFGKKISVYPKPMDDKGLF